MARSDKWDKEENKPFDGFQKRSKDDEHHFELFPDGQTRCIYCKHTREELRKKW